MMQCGFVMYRVYTIIAYETASQAKHALEILMVAIGPSHVREKFYIRYLQTKKLKNLCTLSLTFIWLQEIMLCIKPRNNSTL